MTGQRIPGSNSTSFQQQNEDIKVKRDNESCDDDNKQSYDHDITPEIKTERVVHSDSGSEDTLMDTSETEENSTSQAEIYQLNDSAAGVKLRKDNTTITKKSGRKLKKKLGVGRFINGPESLKYAFSNSDGKEIIGHPNEMIQIDSSVTPKQNKCILCVNKTMTRKDGVEKHLMGHLIKKCIACTFTTESLRKLQSHMLEHENPSWQCLECNESFSKQEDLALHKVLHNGTLICKVCFDFYCLIKYYYYSTYVQLSLSYFCWSSDYFMYE